MLELSVTTACVVFAVSAAVIAVAGSYLSRIADRLADRTRLGEAVAGAVLLGATTSIPGTVTSVVAAADGNVDLAASNALGGIAAQTAFLAIADMVYRRANLEHAAASAANLTQSTLLILMLAIPLVAVHTPAVTVFGVHPATVVLLFAYVAGLRMAGRDRDNPMWQPIVTRHTRRDEPEDDGDHRPLWQLFAVFAALAATIGGAGMMVARTGIVIAERTGLGETVVGTLLTATATSLPELVTTVAAVRQGALQLAVGGIIGGNVFDVLFLSAADVAYRDGSIYHAIGAGSLFWAMVGLVMTAVLLLGLIRREEHGVANIGFESALLLLIYAGAVALMVL
ncbi:sodium:calcium antiporter [Acuticoccus sediminis]|uniref:sodium:calcium antiporter n=1 Tax=Acuticoccus sediminis TaxID=2184697 RepID=UPI001CFD10E5|nr:sodium:calcium antiporter [Acuticoccus sediminis]